MYHINAEQKGFTLMEILIYLAISGIIIAGVSTLLYVMLGARVKQQTINEVEQQGAFMMRYITQAVRNADAITEPASGAAVNLTLNMYDLTDDPMVISLTGNTLSVSRAGEPAIALHSDRVEIANVAFTNVSYAGTPGALSITYTVRSVNPSGRQEYSYEKTFYGSATIR
ncbi:MAG: prepilin-type N-terminal cleavage/methylation domain-containing protein [Candidatus Kerfeldbacteria bacterium]|nr:prepilin-type N-terminal cleavage/methylation domain-containing protein [Candidatus Kerfeldbacteria bacterium]